MTVYNAPPSPPPAVWRWLGLAAVLLLVATVAAISLISTGLFDPQPLGEQVSRQTLSPRTVAAGETGLFWTDTPLPETPASLRLDAEGGTKATAGYGLAVGNPEEYLGAAVSSAGYVALWQQAGSERNYLLPWQPWPHVRPDASNEMQIDVDGEQITIRVNRELLWQGESQLHGRQVALLGQGFADEATIFFQTLTRFE